MLSMTLRILISTIAAIVVVLVHELSKYYISLFLLHPIHRKRSDVKISPLKYIDPIGLILFVFSGVGWQKPGEYNPSKFKDKERALLTQSIVGIASNILLIVAMIPVYLAIKNTNSVFVNQLALLVIFIIKYSFAIIIVNLLPIPPFDMSKIIYALNPSFYFKMIQNERIIQAVFILLIAFNILSSFINSLFGPLYSLIS